LPAVSAIQQVGRVLAIYLADAGGEPMSPVPEAEAIAGEGLRGDRYQLGTGEWSYDRLRSDVTLVAAEALAEAGREQGLRLGPGESRRNIVTQGVDLDALIGRAFRLGEVQLLGERVCAPCRYLDRLTGQPAQEALSGRGGLRAAVLSGGRLRVGDPVTAG
jgi:hypothetical protein